jgi:Holliday junction resolvase RusA-like endonuclease
LGDVPVVVVIPGKPLSVNAATRSVLVRGRPVALKSSEARDFLARAQAAARKAMGFRPMLTGDLTVTVMAYWPRRGADADAAVKYAQDAMSGIVYADDGLVRRSIGERAHDPEHPRVEVTVERYRPPVVVPVPDWHRAWEGP